MDVALGQNGNAAAESGLPVDGWYGYQVNRTAGERRGRRRSLFRTLILGGTLLLVQVPLVLVAAGHLSYAGSALPPEVPVRLWILVNLSMIVVYILVSWRCWELIQLGRAPQLFGHIARGLHAVVLLGALMNLIADVMLWFRSDGETAYPADLTIDRLTFPAAILLLTGLVAMGALTIVTAPAIWWSRGANGGAMPRKWWAGRRQTGSLLPQPWWEGRGKSRRGSASAVALNSWRDELQHPLPAPRRETPSGTIICCSGGGIRSTAFCLGALQALSEMGIYQQARAVVGVSGGGYIAAAMHVLRWRSQPQPDEDEHPYGARESWPEMGSGTFPAAFAPDAPEMHWLRRRTRYLLESAQVITLALLSLFFGIAVNLVLVMAVIVANAWWLGWFYYTSGGLSGWMTSDATGGVYSGQWTWAGDVWWLAAVGAAGVIVIGVIERFATMDYRVRGFFRWLSVYAVWLGLALYVVLLVIPAIMAGLHDFAATSSSPAARLLHQFGLVPTSVCEAQVQSGPACGATQEAAAVATNPGTTFSITFLSVVGSILAVVGAARGSEMVEGVRGLRGCLRKIWGATRRFVLPWVALIVISSALLLFQMSTIASLFTDPSLMGNWKVAGWGGAVLVAIAVFTDANRTSLHNFYKERLSSTFFVAREGTRVAPIRYRDALRFSEALPASPGGGPELVSCAVANASDIEYVPSMRQCTPFIFDSHNIGLTDRAIPVGQTLTSSIVYERAADFRARDATIAAAIAISGAAVSPLAGRLSGRLAPYRIVLALANARLGVWLPNPLWVDDVKQVKRLASRRTHDAAWAYKSLSKQGQDEVMSSIGFPPWDKKWLRQQPDYPTPADCKRWGLSTWYQSVIAYFLSIASKPGAFRLAKEAFGQTSVLDRKLYVTDGGHYDNLGLIEALRRRPKEVIVLDASSDLEDSFKVLGDAVATARMDLDVSIDLDPRKMRRQAVGDQKSRAEVAWSVGKATYSDKTTCKIRFVKVVMIEGLPWDTEAYQLQHPTFPRTSTGNQLYGEFDLEAYRVLGKEVTPRVFKAEAPPAGDPASNSPTNPGGEQKPVTGPERGAHTDGKDVRPPVMSLLLDMVLNAFAGLLAHRRRAKAGRQGARESRPRSSRQRTRRS